MMDLLPPVGWGEVATKTDLMVLEGRLRGEMAHNLRTMVAATVTGNVLLVGSVLALVRFFGI